MRQWTALTILELVNGCKNSGGRDWLKDLLRRQGTSSGSLGRAQGETRTPA